MRTWPLLEEAVEDPTTDPFKKVNGEGAMSYYAKRPDMINLFGKAIGGMSVPFMKEMLDCYDGFQGVETLVDVGGNYGACLRMIMQKYPTMRKGINYDLPQVVAYAPDIPGACVLTFLAIRSDRYHHFSSERIGLFLFQNEVN